MDRFLMDELVAWRDSPRRKPLILNGARQVGKTWLLKEFGRRCFDNVAYVNLDDNPGMREQFEAGYDILASSPPYSSRPARPFRRAAPSSSWTRYRRVRKRSPPLNIFARTPLGTRSPRRGRFWASRSTRAARVPRGQGETRSTSILHFREFLAATGNQVLCNLIETGDADLINVASLVSLSPPPPVLTTWEACPGGERLP